MNHSSAAATHQNENTEAADELLGRNGDSIKDIDQKLTGGAARDFPARAMVINRKFKRKEDGPLEIFCGWITEHQIGTVHANSHTQVLNVANKKFRTGLSVNLLMLLALTHMSFPKARRHTRKFVELSYYNPESGEYCAGWNDAWMVLFWVVAFTALRAAVMDYILSPFAKWGGVKTEKDRTRFAEQAWLLIYYSVFWPLGMVI